MSLTTSRNHRATFLTLAAGALLLSWPAFLNRYPIVFSDTFNYLEQGLDGTFAWDKPWIYGPLLVPIHWRISLWPVALLQSLLLSTMLWLTQRTLLANPRHTFHLILCLILAIGSAAPWFTSLVMPDNFTPICVLGLFILAYGHSRLGTPTLAAVAIVTTITIASHLSHLVVSAACLVILALLRWRTPRAAIRPVIPFAAALTLILSINIVGQGIVAISPYGSVFALARLVADGPAADYIRSRCPQADYYLCAWKDHLPTDSDAFLWDPKAPMSGNNYGAVRLAPEAAEIVRNTVLAYPERVIADATRNTVHELSLVKIGDALIPDWLDLTVRNTLINYFPEAETARFDAALQVHGKLQPIGEAFNPLQTSLLILGAAGTLVIAVTQRRSNPDLAAFAALVLIALLANAFVTGSLSTPHDRYQARIAWLVLLPPLFALARRPLTLR